MAELAFDNLLLVRHFLAVGEAGSFSKAAVMLGVAQPVLSRQMRALEESLGTPLFFRNGRGAVLTEAGRTLVEHARKALDELGSASTQIRAMRDRPGGEVALGIPPMVGAILTIPVVQRFRAGFPGVSLRLVEGFSGYILEWLTTGRLDVAVLYNVAKATAIQTDPLTEESLVLVASAASPPPVEGETVPMALLPTLPLILPNYPHGLRALVNTALAAIGAEPQVVLEVDGMSAVKRLVEHGLGCTLLSAVAVEREVAEGRLRTWAVVDPQMRAEIVLASSTQRPSTQVTRALARIVREEAAQLIDSGRWRV